MITLVGGHIQSSSGAAIPNGSISFQLNVDAAIVASPNGQVPAAKILIFQFDSNGDLVPPAKLYSNEELSPQNGSGLGTYYLVTLFDANGARLNVTPLYWQFTAVANSTVDIGQMTPYRVQGNIIYYAIPSASSGSVSSVGLIGDGIVFNTTVTNSPITTSGDLIPELLSHAANTFLAGPITGSAATPTFRSLAVADLPTSGTWAFAGTISGSLTFSGTPVFDNVPSFPSQSAHLVFAAPSGSSGVPTFRALVSSDFPAGVGTVTSVALTMDGVIFNSSVSGSPITTSGTFAPALISQTANTVLAGPSSGSAAAPTFRSLAVADLPTSGTWAFAGTLSAGFTVSNTETVSGTLASSGGTFSGSWAGNPTFSGTPVFGNVPTFPSQSAHLVFAAPSGGSGIPSFRALVASDLPSGAGTVTSVGLTMDGVIFNSSVTGSPITTSGTLAPSLISQSANLVLAGSTAGSAATPTFRSLVVADIPSLPASQITSGQLAIANGGTGTATPSLVAGTNITVSGSWPNQTINSSGGFTSPMTTLGDIIYEDATPTAARLAGNITTTKEYLSQTGTGSVSATPVWAQIAAADLSNGTLGTGAVVLASAIGAGGSSIIGVDTPPGSPPVENDEFNSASLNAKWTVTTNTVTTVSIDTVIPGAVWVKTGASSTNGYAITEAVASGSGNIALTMKCGVAGLANFQGVFLDLFDSNAIGTNTLEVTIGFNGSMKITFNKYVSGASTQVAITGVLPVPTPSVYLHLQRKSGTSACFYSFTGADWYELGSTTSLSGTTFSQARISMLNNGSANTTTMWCDWIRRDWIDLL